MGKTEVKRVLACFLLCCAASGASPALDDPTGPQPTDPRLIELPPPAGGLRKIPAKPDPLAQTLAADPTPVSGPQSIDGSRLAMRQAPPPPPIPTPSPALAISGPSTVTEGTLAILSLTGGTAASVAWLVLPDTPTFQAGQTCVLTGAPGSYTVIALAVANGSPVILRSVVTILPSSLSKPLLIAIFDPSSLTSLPQGQAEIYQSTTIAPSLASRGTTWLQYCSSDVIPSATGSTPISETTWGVKALAVGLPALVSSVDGVVTAIPLPANQAIILQQAFKGKR